MIKNFDELTRVDGTFPFMPVTFDLAHSRTAVVHIDNQNDFLNKDGHYAQRGIDIRHMQRVIEPTKKLVEHARKYGIPQIWTRHGTRSSVDAGAFHKLRPQLAEGGLRQGSWGYELLEGIGASDEDWYVEKTRLSAFFQTNLEVILRGLGAETIVITGVLTNQCVAATGKDAMFRDFNVIVIEECTGTTVPGLHHPALAMMRVGWAEVTSLDDIVARISGVQEA